MHGGSHEGRYNSITMRFSCEPLMMRGLIVKKSEKLFVHGIAYAAAELIRTFDEPVMAKHLINAGGYKLEDLEKAKVDDYDLKEIKKALA